MSRQRRLVATATTAPLSRWSTELPLEPAITVDEKPFFPSNTGPHRMLEMLQEAASKFNLAGAEAQSIALENGIIAKLVVKGGKVITFFPEFGPGVVWAKELVKVVP